MKKKTSILKILSIIAGILISILLIVALLPLFASYKDTKTLSAYVESFGIWGAFVLLAIQIIQIVIAIIPGELTEFVSGTLYGAIFGSLISVSGVVIGQFLVFILVKWLGAKFAWKMVSGKEFKKLKFLNDEKKLDLTIFLLFFIPGTPKDVLTYFVPMTKIKLDRFLLLSSVARLPSIISSAYAGATFAEGDFSKTLIAYLAIGSISILGLFIHHKILNKGEKNG